MLNGLSLFLNASGISINRGRSSLFTCCINTDVKHEMLGLAEISEGSFPMSYLGVPIKPTKWNKNDCATGVEKIQRLITYWGIKHLSFAGRI